MRVDDATLDGDDPMKMIDPVWWTVDIYNGAKSYASSLQTFSKPQRLTHAMLWYLAEVNNGGHHQFYSNSTGIVWRNALEGFEEADLPDVAALVLESALRLGGTPSSDREERLHQLHATRADFDDLDDQFSSIERANAINEGILDYVRYHRADFYFDGVVRKPLFD
ncbi:MAG TPA: DMP19 family protein [Rhizomicrobium sp.]|nr:DMP19 family protein [Rhizomicrobium sp.]